MGKSHRKSLFGRRRHRGEDNIKLDIQVTGWGMDWIDITQDRDGWWGLENVKMNVHFP